MTSRIVVVDEGFGDIVVETVATADAPVRVEYRPCTAEEQIAEAAADADAVIVRFLPMSRRTIERLPALRAIGRYGVGVDNVDLDAATDRGVAVVNVPDYCVEEVAHHALALMLASWRRLPEASALVAGGRWNDWAELEPIRPLSECVLGLVGLGRIGHQVAALSGGLFGRTLVLDPYADDLPPDTERRHSLRELLGVSDVVSLHCPLTPDTANLLDAESLAWMRPGSLLVNVSRGALVDPVALRAALEAGRPGRAALDVLDVEPPGSGHPLLGHPAVLQTPHVAWYSTAAEERLRRSVARRVADRLLGRPVPSVVNAAALDGRTATSALPKESVR